MEIRSLEGIHIDILYNAFSLAFKDYDVQIDKSQLIKMLKRRGFSPNLSYAYFENGEIISFILNGIGSYNGTLTAYDTGTGTIEKYRGKGLASNLFEYSVQNLKNKNIKQYLLEVLQQNTHAVSLYKKKEFRITRELNYYIQSKDKFTSNNHKAADYLIKHIDFDLLEKPSMFWDFNPTWQNSIEAIKRDFESFKIIASFVNGVITGYCIYEPDSGDICQVAVIDKYRRKGIATSLISQALLNINSETIKIINTESSFENISCFLASFNAKLSGKQYEMIKTI